MHSSINWWRIAPREYLARLSDTNLSAFIWSVADLLRGDYKQSDYGKVILPFTVLRRLDCVLEPTKAAVLEEKALREGQGLDPEPFMLRKAEQLFGVFLVYPIEHQSQQFLASI